MNRMKKAIAVLLAVALMVPSMGVAAASSPVLTSIAGKTATVTKSYTGKDQTLTIVIGGKTLKENKDFILVSKEPTKVGNYTLTIKGIGAYEGTTNIKYSIKKASKPVVTVSAKALTAVKKPIKASTLKKKSKTIKLGVKTDGKVTYTIKCKKSLKSKITVSKKGKVTLKKGIKKGTYKIVINIKGTKNFKAGKKTITIKVK